MRMLLGGIEPADSQRCIRNRREFSQKIEDEIGSLKRFFLVGSFLRHAFSLAVDCGRVNGLTGRNN
jgi:hypothetical protein